MQRTGKTQKTYQVVVSFPIGAAQVAALTTLSVLFLMAEPLALGATFRLGDVALAHPLQPVAGTLTLGTVRLNTVAGVRSCNTHDTVTPCIAM